MIKKKWTVVRVMATAKGELPAVYFPSEEYYWFKYSAVKAMTELGDLFYKRSPVLAVTDFLSGTGWHVVRVEDLGKMTHYQEVEKDGE